MSKDILDELLKDYSIDKVYKCSDVSCAGFTPLMLIVMNTHQYPQLNTLIVNYIDSINCQNLHGPTALMLASLHVNTLSSIDTIKLLINYGAEVNTRDIRGNTTIMYATKSNDIKTIAYLLKHGANINDKANDGTTALSVAIRYHDFIRYFNTIKFLLDHGADIYERSATRGTPMNRALSYNYMDICKLLLNYYNFNDIKILMRESNSYLLRVECLNVLEERLKLEKIKTKNYIKVLENIHEHDAKIRFKEGNMGYQISMIGYGGVINDKLLDYLSATMDNVHEKAAEYLQC